MSEAVRRGDVLAATADIGSFLEEEQRLGVGERFATIDAILGVAIEAALKGQEIIETSFSADGNGALRLTTLSDAERVWLDQFVSKSAHESRGSWYLPETVKIPLGPFRLVKALTVQPRFAATIIAGDGAEGSSESGEAVFVWAALRPFFEALAAPLLLRSKLAGTKSAADVRRAWAAFDGLAEVLGIADEEALRVFRSPEGWESADSELHTERRLRLGEMLQRHAGPELGRRYRAYRLRELIRRYYSKAKKDRPTKAQVLTKAEERTLTFLCGGDWLAFLEIIGEPPAEGEEVVTALPEPKLFVGAARAEAVAASAGVSAEEVNRILGAVFGSSEAVSPIREREAALRRVWRAFEDFYARQESSMLSPTLYLFGEEWSTYDDLDDDSLDAPRLSWETARLLTDLRDVSLASEELKNGSTTVRLDPEVIGEVERLWGRETIERFPTATVTALEPWRHAEAALGPAFKFWHGVLCRIWSDFEERYDENFAMKGLRSGLKLELEALKELGFPVDGALFDDLARVEGTLPPAQDIVSGDESSHSSHGIVITVIGISGQRRAGFDKLRDVVLEHRRAWTEKHLDSYLERRWQDDLRDAAGAINKHHAQKGKAPTARQLSEYGAVAANTWCGGNLGVLCAAIGEKDTLRQTSTQLVPADRRMFVRKLFAILGGRPVRQPRYATDDEATQERLRAEADQQRGIAVFAIGGLRYLQLQEALGGPPTLKQFGAADFKRYATRSWGEETFDEEHWGRYWPAVQSALASDVAPAALPAPSTSREPVVLRDAEPRVQKRSVPEFVQASTPSAQPKRGGLLGRLFGGAQAKQTTVTVDAYELESSGLSDVVGESYYQDALVATRDVLRRDDQLDCDVFDAILVAEPDNEYDSEAVAVYSTRGKIGHAPRGSGWFEVLSIVNGNGHAAATCRASLTGGDKDRELGAILHGDPDSELERLTS